VRVRRSRKSYEPSASDHPGEINIKIESPEAPAGSWVLTVTDNGIGMPEDVLTGEFLDFGKSLWRSDHVASLYPGLAAQLPTPNFWARVLRFQARVSRIV
jgi:hypothetical protein